MRFKNVTPTPTRERSSDFQQEDRLWNNRYIMLYEIGSGSFGNVYRAYDTHVCEFVAVKEIKKNDDERVMPMRVVAEVLVLESIKRSNSPHKEYVVEIKDFFVRDENSCIVFELLKSSLSELIEPPCLGWSLALTSNLAKQLLTAVDFLSNLHGEYGVAHADIKPDNILVGRTIGKFKLIDMGLSFPTNSEARGVVQSLPYRAPEVCLHLPYNGAIDIWSIGCVLVECITTKELFPCSNLLEHMQAIVEVLGLPPIEMINTSPVHQFYFNLSEETVTVKVPCCGEQGGLPGSRKLADIMGLNEKDEIASTFLDLVIRMLDLDPSSRIRPADALKHPFFDFFE